MARRRAGMRGRLNWDRLRILAPRNVGRLIRREPRLLGWLLLCLAIPFGMYLAVLALLGRLDAIGTWALLPWLMSGDLFVDRLVATHQRLDRAERRS